VYTKRVCQGVEMPSAGQLLSALQVLADDAVYLCHANKKPAALEDPMPLSHFHSACGPGKPSSCTSTGPGQMACLPICIHHTLCTFIHCSTQKCCSTGHDAELQDAVRGGHPFVFVTPYAHSSIVLLRNAAPLHMLLTCRMQCEVIMEKFPRCSSKRVAR